MALTTSPSLLLRIRDPQDHDSWEQFLSIYSSIVRDYCFQRRLQPTDVEDVVQEVMARVCKSIRSFEYDPQKGRFRAWLGTIAANQIKTLLSKRAKNNGRPTDTLSAAKNLDSNNDAGNMEAGESAYTDPDSEWVAIFSEKIFRTACCRVRPTVTDLAWECFQATWIRDQDATEVANANGITVNAVYVHKYKVLKKLESEIKMIAEDVPTPRDVINR